MSRGRYIITVDRDGLAKAETEAPILVESPKGDIQRFSRVVFPAGAVMVYGPQRRDGARVWVEADDVKGS